MNYYFQNYRFESATRNLYQGDTSTLLRASDAKLLAVFLQKPKKILSKEEIINIVWGHNVVSEQAIFQGVSQLRNRFGSGAIKTFPRKGYMWMFEVDSLEGVSESDLRDSSIDRLYLSLSESKRIPVIADVFPYFSAPKKRHRSPALIMFAALVCIFFSLLFFLSYQHTASSQEKTTFAVLPITFGDLKTREHDEENNKPE